MAGHIGSNAEAKESFGIHFETPGAVLNFFTCSSFIKLCNQARGKQINTDNDACADKYISGEHPPSGESGVRSQPVEQKIIRDILRPLGKREEGKIKYQQGNAHYHAEQTDKGNKLPVLFKASQQEENTAGTCRNKNERCEKIERVHFEQYSFDFLVSSME